MLTPPKPLLPFRTNLRRAATVVLMLVAGPWIPAQTTFLGSWEEPRIGWVYGSRIIVVGPKPLVDPNLNRVVGPFTDVIVVALGQEPITQESWIIDSILVHGQPPTTYEDSHWSNAQVWSAGLPTVSTDARVNSSKSILLPAVNESAAAARSLTLFATEEDASGDYVWQTVTLSGGTLNLTPLAFNESLRVGVASALPKYRETIFVLDGATLTSTGFAKIGVGVAVGAGGRLRGSMELKNGSNWFHPAGSIEVGGGAGSGSVLIQSGSTVAGSFLPGASIDPQLVLTGTGSDFIIANGGAARLSEVHLNGGTLGMGLTATLAVQELNINQGGRLAQDFEINDGLGSVSVNQAMRVAETGSGTFGGPFIATPSGNLTAGTILVGGSAGANGNVYLSGPATIGTSGASGSEKVVTLGRDPGANGLMMVVNSSVSGFPVDVEVHGAVEIGRSGTGRLQVDGNRVLNIHGELKLATSSATGVATLEVIGTVSAQNVEVGTNTSDSDYGGSPSSPFPAGQATVKMQGGTLAITGTSETVFFPFPHTINTPGELTLGGNDLIQGDGTIAFTNPNGGTLKAIGTISPGLSLGDQTREILVQGHLRLNNGNAPLTPAGATLQIDLGGTASGFFDVLRVTGDANLNRATVVFSLVNNYSPVSGASFHFLQVDGTLTGMFGSLIDNTGLGLTLSDLSIAETGGLKLALPATAIPEVGVALPAVVSALVALFRVRRKSAQRRFTPNR